MTMLDPFVKWAGGKRWLATKHTHLFPDVVTRYIEPFLGGGAIFFKNRYSGAILADINSELIECYKVIRDEWESLDKLLEIHHANHSKVYYYFVRSSSPENRVERAGRFLYLNRTCWNGLYRVNLKGEFNVPIGTKSSVVMDTDNFEEIAAALKGAKLRASDFRVTLRETQPGDFVYLDPPYTVKHNVNGFVKYNERIFSWNDQLALKEEVVRLKRLGARVLISQANHESIRELYKDVGVTHVMQRNSNIAANSYDRSEIEELLIKVNY